MKAKEIIQRVLENATETKDATEALVIELTADLLRMQREPGMKVGSGTLRDNRVWVRRVRDYNSKWNVVITALQKEPIFFVNGDPNFTGLQENDYLRHLCALGKSTQAEIESMIQFVTSIKAEPRNPFPWQK